MPELNAKTVEESQATMKDKFPTMVQYFIEDTTTYINNIQEGLAEKSASKVKSPAHTIKSSAKLFGASKISELAEKIEHLACDIEEGKETDLEKVTPVFEELKKAYSEAEPELKSLL